jgi:DnaJ-class molecular chaperone
MKNMAAKADTNFRFCQICEAFEVLSTDELRAVYDRYGEHILKNGSPGNRNIICLTSIFIDQKHKGYSFNGDPMEIFESFFGTVNPFTIAIDD